MSMATVSREHNAMHESDAACNDGHPRWRARRGRLDRPMLPVGVIEAQELKTYMAVRCPSIDVTIT